MWVIIYGFGPLVIAGIVGGGFAIYLVHNSRKAKHAKTVNSTSETRQETINKLLGGATIEDREKTGSKWKAPEQLQELAKAEKVDIFSKKTLWK